jgi:two-component system, sensor histidine kinase and response regulator
LKVKPALQVLKSVNTSKSSILVVDDEPSGFEVIESILFDEGYELQYASSGNAAIMRLKITLPDLILLDVMMPDIDGIEVCRSIKTNPDWRHIPIIMVTALNSKVVLSRCLETGADDFIDKPVSALELRARVRSMLRIKRQYDALQASLQLRQDLSDMVIHDLRNPLASIILSCEILYRTDLQAKQRQKVDQILKSGQQLQSMVDTLLLMAKLESGKMLLKQSPADLCELVEQAASDFQAIAASKQIDLICDFPEQRRLVEIDITLFHRILENLLSNAIKFSPAQSQIQLQVDFPANLNVRLQVIDQGVGVVAEMQEAIFEKYQVGQVMKGIAQTGLGLAFCKMAVEAHNGRIFVENNFPKGAIFTVEI